MLNRPKCEIENCINEGFLYYKGKWICGECYQKILEKQNKNFWEMNK
jgi:hypothetical protein